MTSKQFLYIVIITVVTILAWVVLDILHARSSIEISSEVQQLIEPINPKLDQEAINEL